MQLEPQQFLRLAERAKTIASVDIEATGLKGDYNSTLVVAIKPFGLKPYSFSVTQPGNDQRVVREAKAALEQYDAWVTFYGKGYDIPFLNTRLLKWGLDPIDKRHHVDMFYTLKYNILTARKSQAHLLRWLGTPQQKMDMSPEEWNAILADVAGNMPRMIARCESDVRGLEGLYKRCSHLIRDIKK